MNLFLQALLSLAGTVAFYAAYRLYRTLHYQITSSIRDLPGPQSSSWIFGSLKEIGKAENSVLHEKWVEQYGRTMKYRGFFGFDRLFTVDTKALNHILMNHYTYQKPEVARWGLSRLLGDGVLSTEEDKHKLQRKIMNPAFGSSQVRELTEIFVDKSIELRDIWASLVDAEGGRARINVLAWLSKTTLDVIGLAGFNYKFNALDPNGHSNELNKAFSTIFGDPDAQRVRLWPIMQGWFPVLRALPGENAPGSNAARNTMNRIGKELLHNSKTSLLGTGEKANNWSSRDLLSLLVRSNMSDSQSQKMSDEDVLAQVPTFLVAGHETTSTATTWALFALTEHLDVQRKLRDELYTLSSENPSMDELNSLPYLDAVVRETLRVHAPVPSTIRVATRDDVIPLSQPFTDTKGITRDSIIVQEGQTIFIPILTMNRDKSLWGEDSMEFKPERWNNVPEAVASIPGVWGSQLTFLGGARACIGYRFSLVEMKALLFVLVRRFEFELAVPREDIIKKSSVVQRPRVKSEPDGGSQLPLLVRIYQEA